MKNKRNLQGIIAIMLVFVAVIISCDDGSTNGTTGGSTPVTPPVILNENGTWYSSGNIYKYYFNNGVYEYSYNGNQQKKGNYSISNNKDSITMTISHLYFNGTTLGGYSGFSSYTGSLTASNWYTRDQIKDSYLTKIENDARTTFQDAYNYIYSLWSSAPEIVDFILTRDYGTSNINTYVNTQRTSYENSINTSLDALYGSSIVAYSLRDNILTIGGGRLTQY